MATRAAVAREINQIAPIKVQLVDRDRVINDFLKAQPGWQELGRAWGGLSAHVTTHVLRNVLEAAKYPGRLDPMAALKDAYLPRKCNAMFTEPSGEWAYDCGKTIEPSAKWTETLCVQCLNAR